MTETDGKDGRRWCCQIPMLLLCQLQLNFNAHTRTHAQMCAYVPPRTHAHTHTHTHLCNNLLNKEIYLHTCDVIKCENKLHIKKHTTGTSSNVN